MQDTWQFLLVFSAVAIGWLLGRRGRWGGSDNDSSPELPRQYYTGLNYLLNDQADGAIDAFIDALEVNSETLETHLAVGNLMRRKGEVDRAIRIHQNLLARPSLPRHHLHQAHLELARDFISAGLFDRAERLLDELIVEAPALKQTAMRHLLEIYQDEKDWEKAVTIAQQLLPKKGLLKARQAPDDSIPRSLSHYCCELGQQAMDKNDYQAARGQLRKALVYDRNCVRASMLLAEVEGRTGHHLQALKALKKVKQQDPVYLPDIVPQLKQSFQHLGDAKGYRQYLLDCLEIYPSVTILLALSDELQGSKGDAAAASFIGGELRQRPSLRGLSKLVELHVGNSSGRSRDNLTILQMLIEQLLIEKPLYRCDRCGFSGKQLHWLCPSCREWGTVKSIRGAEGD